MDERDPDDDGATIVRAGQALIEAVPAPAKVILFGSHARGDGDDRSGFDFLVIERKVDDRFDEMARLDPDSRTDVDPGRCDRGHRGGSA